MNSKKTSTISNDSTSNSELKDNKKQFYFFKSKRFKLGIFILLIISIILVLFFTFHKNISKYFYNFLNNNEENLNTSIQESQSIDSEKVEKTKPVTNYELLNCSNLIINSNEHQNSASITIHNTSSEPCSNFILSISLVNEQNEEIISFDSYIKELPPDGDKTIKMSTKEDISQVSDYLVTKKD